MQDQASRSSWKLRPGPATERLIGAGLAVAIVLLGWERFLETENVVWLLLLGLLGLFAAVKGGRLLLAYLHPVGLFGRVRVVDGRLRLGRSGGSSVVLDEPFGLDLRLDQTELRHEFRMRDVGGGSSRATRTERKAVTVLLARLTQDDTSVDLAADDTRPPPPPTLDLQGLPWRRARVELPQGSVLRMRQADWIELAHVLAAAPGGKASGATQDQPCGPDPRTVLWASWRRYAATALVLVLGALVAWWVFDSAEADSIAESRQESQAAAEKAATLEAEAQTLIGRRVHFEARKGIRLLGTVTAVALGRWTVYEPEIRSEQRPQLTVTVEALLDPDGNTMPADAEVGYPQWYDTIQAGAVVEVFAHEVEVAKDE